MTRPNQGLSSFALGGGERETLGTRLSLHFQHLLKVVGGDRGREVYGRREKRGREAGFPRWREAGEKVKNYATLHNISQSKKCKGAGAKKYRVGTGIKGYGKREVQTPLSPPTK